MFLIETKKKMQGTTHLHDYTLLYSCVEQEHKKSVEMMVDPKYKKKITTYKFHNDPNW